VLNATDSGPPAAAAAVSFAATVPSASSQPMRSQPGSAASLGVVRRSGCSSRDGCRTISGAALPLTQRARPVGCDGSGSNARKVPSVTSARAPHRDTHNGQYVGTRCPPTTRF
jgi:hypothetical protein